MSELLNVAIVGANGRMGRALVQAIHDHPQCRLSGALEHDQSPALGMDAGFTLGLETGVEITHDAVKVLSQSDVLIDFSRPESTLNYLTACEKLSINMIIGTTGFDEAGKARIAEAAKKIGIVFAANYSVGVNLTFALIHKAAQVLNDGFDIEVIEAHHRHKVDAPSGTALRMGEVLADAIGKDLKDVGVFAREGITGPREAGSIGFATVRGGDIVGDHTVMFAADGERVEVTHKASSRATFANGAVRAAAWLRNQPVALYDMQDVLDLRW